MKILIVEDDALLLDALSGQLKQLNYSVCTATSVAQGSLYSFTPTAADVDSGTTLVFSISNKPAWASFSSSTGVLSGTPQRSDVGTTQSIVISVSDGELSASLPAFNLQVVAVNEAPQAENDSFTLPFSLSGTYALNVLANDTDPDNDSLSITFAKTSIGHGQLISVV